MYQCGKVGKKSAKKTQNKIKRKANILTLICLLNIHQFDRKGMRQLKWMKMEEMK